MPIRSLLLVLLAAMASPALLMAEDSVAALEPVRFNRDIRQILADKCFACHGPDENTREADLRFDDEAALFADPEHAVIQRGDPGGSELVARINHTDPDERMPPASAKKPLSPQEIALLTRWIAEGAKWEGHWAYIKPVRPAVPASASPTANNPIDGFLDRRIAAAKLTPVPPANPTTLVRRLYFDLLGLPPEPAVVEAFVRDPSPAAYEKLVDDLLASPHFGERMAIYWLDVVRFADSNGYHSDEPRTVGPYRDYVIEAFNANKPYDQFVLEQLAGDLLPEATMEQKVASGFNMLLQTTSEGGAQAKEYLAKYSADRVRNTSQIFLGSTLGCSECHDHKFDPFTAHDFYSFAAFFADIKEAGVGNPPAYPVMSDEAKAQLAQADARLSELRAKLTATTPELETAQAAWEASLAEGLSGSAKWGNWHMIGPFKAASFDAAHDTPFGPESDLTLTKKHGELAWKEAKQFTAGAVHALSPADNAATYLTRTATVTEATKLTVSLGSDDSLALWLNGKQVHNEKTSRPAAPDQSKVTLELAPGENHLLLKIANGTGSHAFYFQANSLELPAGIIAILKTPAAERTEAQQKQLVAHYRTIAPTLVSVREEITQVEAAKKHVQETLPKTLMTSAGAPRTIRLLRRGNWMDDTGPEMQPAIPAFLGKLEVEGRRANRLDLARWIVDQENPLTARTFANRLWMLYFGRGLATPLDDLGAQGTEPTHPDLLDWLALEFMETGWDVKATVKTMLMSAAYQRSSVPTDALRQADPYNRLYARQARFRLEAELVRDNALAISGLLVDSIGGRSVKPYQPAGYWQHMNFPRREWQAEGDENLYRRGVYTWWQRMFLHPAMMAFDAPSREECVVERPRSNTPQQALVLLNDPTYVEAARAFAERMLTTGGENFETRLAWAYEQALSRKPRADEAAVMQQVFKHQLETYQADEPAARALIATGNSKPAATADPAELAAYTAIARVILNLHETITRH